MSDNQSQVENDEKTREEDTSVPFFSVVLPTRNRPDLLAQALQSVLNQSLRNIEVLVVNDGSDDEFLPQYRAMEENSDARVSWHYQPQRLNGHGPSYSINTGAQSARGRYLCILDDDDNWEDLDHLRKAREVILASSRDVDVYYSNQSAYTADGRRMNQYLWLSSLLAKLPPAQSGINGVHEVTAEFLLGCNGFPHLNCTIIRRDFFMAIGGMDESIRYECEVDLYLRTLDAASVIIYNPEFVARHNVPDSALNRNVSTSVSRFEKSLSQVTVYQKNLARAPARPIRDACFIRLSRVYKQLASEYLKVGQFASALVCARTALACNYSLKWRLYCLYITALSVMKDH